MTAQLVADALMMAIWRRGRPDTLLHHSDQRAANTSRNDRPERRWNCSLVA
jgi:putative transposase